MTVDLDHLEALAKEMEHAAVSPNRGRNVDWSLIDRSSAAILALIAEVRALREDEARLDSGCIVTYERDEFGEEYTCERRGNDLRAMIDAARREKA